MNSMRFAMQRGIRLTVAASIACAVTIGLLQTAWAQRAPAYQGLPLAPQTDPDAPEFDAINYKKLDTLRRQVLIGSAPLDANTNSMRRWYGLVFSRMTQPDRLDKLPQLRQEMVRDLSSAKSQSVHTFLLDTIYRGMATLMQESVSSGGRTYRMHPAVRFNALLMIGDLNKIEKGIQQPVPVPYRPALGVFVSVLRDPNQPEALKMAALLGIQRHAKLDWGAPSAERFTRAQRDGLVSMMLKIAKGSGDSESATAGETWMRRRALETLAVLGAVGRLNEVNQVIGQIVANDKAAPSLRCTAASVLRFVPEQADVQPARTATDLGQLTTLICKNELAWIAAIQEKELAKKSTTSGYSGMGMGYGEGAGSYGMPGSPGGGPGMGMGMGMGMDGPDDEESGDYYGMGMGEGGGYPGGMGGYGGYPGTSGTGQTVPEDPKLTLARRRLKYQLVRIDQGLKGLQRAALGGPDAAKVDKIAGRFEDVLAATDIGEGEDPTLEVLAENIRRTMTELALLTGSGASKADDADVDAIGSGPVVAPSGPGTSPVGPGANPTVPPVAPSGPGANPIGPGANPVGPGANPVAPAGGNPPSGGPATAPVGG